MELRPLRPGERPLVLMALDEALDMAYLHLHSGLLVPAVLLALEVVVEKPQLQPPAVVGVEMRPVFDAVRLQPLVFRRGAHEAFDIAARMEPLPAPVGGREKRYLDPVPHRRARLVIGVVERMRQDLVAEIGAVLVKLLVGKRVVAAHQLAGDAAAGAALADAVLDGFYPP